MSAPSPLFSRRLTSAVEWETFSIHPVELIFEEITPHDSGTYVAIDEKTDFSTSDYQRVLDRLRAKEPPCPTKP